MEVTRSEMHKREKEKRKKRFRRLLTINAIMLGLLVVLLVVWLSTQNFAFTDSDKPAGETASVSSTQSLEPETAAPDETGSTEGASDSESDQEADNGAEVANGGENTGGPTGEASAEPEQTDEPADNGAVAGDGANDGNTVHLAFVGDILLGASVADMIDQYGYDYPYKESKLYLSEPDITAGNLEYPVTERGVPAEDKTYVFKGSPDALPALRDSGIDVVSLANNHTLDQGVEGLLDTMDHLDEAGIRHMGAGNNDTEAFAPVIIEQNGIKVAYIGLSRVVPDISWKADKNVAGVAETYDTTRAVTAIRNASEQADVVVVMVHWGKERSDTPQQYQRDFAKQYIDAGADLVIGSHPHVMQGFETYKGKWIAYSLGNFIFSAYPKDTTGETGVLDAVCSASGDCDLQFYPMSGKLAQPKLMETADAEALLSRLTSISFGVTARKDGTLAAE